MNGPHAVREESPAGRDRRAPVVEEPAMMCGNRMMRSVAAAACAAGIVLAGTGCERTSEAPAPDQTQPDAADGLGAALQQGKEAAIAAAREGLASAEKQVSELRTRAQTAPPDKQPEADRALKNAETKLVGLRTRLGEMGKQGEDSWRQFATEFQRDLKDLSDSVKEAMARLNAG